MKPNEISAVRFDSLRVCGCSFRSLPSHWTNLGCWGILWNRNFPEPAHHELQL